MHAATASVPYRDTGTDACSEFSGLPADTGYGLTIRRMAAALRNHFSGFRPQSIHPLPYRPTAFCLGATVLF